MEAPGIASRGARFAMTVVVIARSGEGDESDEAISYRPAFGIASLEMQLAMTGYKSL
jgi:hypothetical protein